MKRNFAFPQSGLALRLCGVALTVMIACGQLGRGGGGNSGERGPSAETIANVPAGAVDPAVDRFRVPVGTAPIEGRGDAAVTIVEYSDFQCPYCSRVVATFDQIEKTYGDKVRISFKHNPLPFHDKAMGAAQAAVAAQQQGKFWPMYHALFKNQQALAPADLDKYAKEIGLDLAKYKKDFESAETKATIKANMDEAAKLGARGTPFSFINGRPLSGAVPFEKFKEIVDQELAAADKAKAAGVKPTQMYDALTKNGKAGAPQADNKPQQPPQPPPIDPTVWKVSVPAGAPVRGNKDAEVTIVEWSDFQCPFCSRVEPTLDQMQKKYGDKLRIVWRHNPLPFHDKAMGAAQAAIAAGEQGKFWEMHDVLYKNQQKLDEESIKGYATELGLNMKKFEATYASDKTKKLIAADMDEASGLGSRGTPSFFINGRRLQGAQPAEQFEKAIDMGMKDAEAALAKGVKRDKLYSELVKDGKVPPEPDRTVYKAPIGDGPMKGPKDARVTIVEYSDFQCPFCSRAEPTIDEVMKAYPNDVRVVFKQLPLPFHNNAHLAAEAALAAKEQGKFWEMHGVLFKNQQALERPNLEKYAAQIGLDVDKFKAALDGGTYKKKVDEELAEGNKIGARGTPSFFVNGRPLVGAQPFPEFKKAIDFALKDADELMKKKHIKADKVYETLMKDAKDSAAAPGAADSAAVIKVDGGMGPSKGPVTAPIQIVQFSDFQCPFCSKVEPTVTELMAKYPGKIRLTWRNYPLPMHPAAGPAAEAALAAGEQGKFWEMHEKLFANQQALDRAAFEKYAKEIGLDMAKFTKALDSGAEKAKVAADVAYANGLPGGGMGTPTFFINGRKISGAQPLENFVALVDEELKKKKK